jgi:RAD50-interacting protein 1
MRTEVQTILNDLGIERNALTEFITALLPILQRKIEYISPELLQNGSLLSHFVYESLSFDKAIYDKYFYVPTGRDRWDGITQHFLESPRNFKTWRDVEKNCR